MTQKRKSKKPPEWFYRYLDETVSNDLITIDSFSSSLGLEVAAVRRAFTRYGISGQGGRSPNGRMCLLFLPRDLKSVFKSAIERWQCL